MSREPVGAYLLRIDRHQLGARCTIILRLAAHRVAASNRAATTWSIHGTGARERPSLLGHQREVDQRRPVTADRFGQVPWWWRP